MAKRNKFAYAVTLREAPPDVGDVYGMDLKEAEPKGKVYKDMPTLHARRKDAKAQAADMGDIVNRIVRVPRG